MFSVYKNPLDPCEELQSLAFRATFSGTALALLQSVEQLLDVEIVCNLHGSSCIFVSVLILQMYFLAQLKSLSGKESIWQHYHLQRLGL